MRMPAYLLLAILACSGSDPARGSIEASELAARLSSGTAPTILDVRTPEEFASGHIPGAVNIPHTELSGRLQSLDLAPDQEVVVHCERGGRAAAAEAILREAGHTHVRSLAGHMEGWRKAAHPLD